MNEPVAVVGTGLVGRGWSIVFARAGLGVRLWDAEPGKAEEARTLVEDALPGLGDLGLLGEDSPEAVLSRIEVTADLHQAVEGVAHVQECTPERVEVKQEVFHRLAAATDSATVLASSTSGIVASAFSADLGERERCLVAHPLNPPHLTPLVELVPAPWTSREVLDRTRELMIRTGQVPITLRREIAGFVVNRLQGALLQEACRLVEDGVTDADGVDAAVAEGLGCRWSFMGPFETIDLNAPGGIVDYIERYGSLYHDLAVDGGPPRTWGSGLAAELERTRRASLPAESLAERGRWRDRRLAELAAHKRRVAQSDREG